MDFALAAVAEGDSRKKQQHKKKNKLLDPAAAVSCCGGGFATLADGHAGEESRRRTNSRTARTAEQPNSPNSRTAEQPNNPNSRTTRTAEQPEQLPPLPSASLSPSASVVFPVPKLFIIVPFYKY